MPIICVRHIAWCEWVLLATLMAVKGPALSAIRAAPAGNRLDNLDLFAVLFYQVSDEDQALVAAVRRFEALKTRIVGVEGVVVLVGCGMFCADHRAPSCGQGPSGVCLAGAPAGPFLYPTPIYPAKSVQ